LKIDEEVFPMRKTRTVFTLALVAPLLTCAIGAHAQGWPQKPIHIIVPYAAGGAVDSIARTFGPQFQRAWGQPVLVENRPGAGGHLGAEVVAKSAPDGLTLMITSMGGQAAGPALYRKLNYDPVKDLVAVSPVGWAPNIMVINPSLPAASFNDFIALARKGSGKLNYGSTGVGSGPNLVFEMLKSAASISLEHIPYKGDALLQLAIVANEVQAAMLTPTSIMTQIKAGKLRALATTGTTRWSTLPDLPTIVEAGFPGVVYAPSVGFLAPSATPREIVNRINAETAKGATDPEMVKTHYPRWGLDPEVMASDAFHARYLGEIESFKRVVRDAKIPLID
jgi:tripartite-type tricarboxylate transporter receptor subunit TctC